MNSKREKILSEKKIEKRYYRLYTSNQIDFLFPTISKATDSTYNLDVDVRKSKEFKLDVGGHFSSRAVNTGYFSLAYRKLGKTSYHIKSESYFGKFYGSIKTEINIEIPSVYPISITPYFVMNKWDYFYNFATFFEDNKPSYLIQKETYYGIKFNHPIGNTSKSTLDFRVFSLEDDYYQTSNFTNKDLTDITFFNGNQISWQFLKNSLNRKQFATSGHYFSFKAKYINGKEHTLSGSTNTILPFDIHKNHSWFNLTADFQSYLINNPLFHLGIHAKGVLNSQSLFANYTASLLALTSFSPTPDAETYFLPVFRSPKYVGAGVNLIFTLKKKVDLRIDSYLYQPFITLNNNNSLGEFENSKIFKEQLLIVSSSLIYNSFFGPIRATVNYFPHQLNPISFQVSYGFIIFNERAIR